MGHVLKQHPEEARRSNRLVLSRAILRLIDDDLDVGHAVGEVGQRDVPLVDNLHSFKQTLHGLLQVRMVVVDSRLLRR